MGILGVLPLHAVLTLAGAPDIEWNAVEGCPSPAETRRRTQRFLGVEISAYSRSLSAVVAPAPAPEVGGQTSTTLHQGDLVRVGPTVRRRFVTGDEGVTLLALGGTRGKPYSPSWGG